ncbi:MAG: hypothetical protein KGS61_13970, partial [Verrucomicrobia bacterium]|nr:hypothetical protein [Verrucomicrobiota bacterium]
MTKKHTFLRKTMLLFGFTLATTGIATRAFAATPSVRALATDPIALQGGSGATFTLVRVGDTNSAITVNYTVTGTATAGTDYTSLPGSVTLAAGQTVAHIPVTPLANPNVAASDKTIDLTLVVGSGYNITLPAEARMTLISDRKPPAFVRISAPRIGQVFQMGANVTLVADVADPDNTTQVQFFSGSTLLGTATSLPFSVVVTNPPPGTYTLTAKATDTLGDPADASAPVTVTVNNYPPTLAMTSPANGTIVTGVPPAVTLTAVVTDTDDSVTNVVFDDFNTTVGTGVAGPNNTYTLTLPNVANGTHSYHAHATDANGASAVSASVQVLVQTTLPAVSLTSPSPLSTYNFGDAIPVTALASSPYGVAEVDFYAGSTKVGSAVPGVATSPFNASFSLPSQLLKPGNYKISAKATDIYGRALSSTSVAVTIAPVPVSITLNAPVNNLLITGSNIPPVIYFSATATTANINDPIHIVDFYVDGKVIKSITNGTPPVNNIYTFTTGTIANGSHTVYAQAIDQFGAKANSLSASVNVLNFAPNILLLSPVSNQTFSGLPTFSAVAADADDVLTKVQFLAGGNVIGTVNNGPNIVSNTYTFTWLGATAGKYSVTAIATDVNGLTTQGAVATNVTVGYFGPTVAITSPTNGTSLNPSSLPLFESVQVNASDSVTNITKVELYDNGTAAADLIAVTTPVPPQQSLTASMSVVLAPGTHKLVAKAYDADGLTALSSTNQLTIGNATPGLTLVSPTNGTAITVSKTVAPTVTLKAVATDSDDKIAQVTFADGGNVVATVANSANIVNNTYTYTLTNVAAGTHVYTATAVDAFGASVTSSAATVTVTNQAPTITLVGLTNGTTFSYPVNAQ